MRFRTQFLQSNWRSATIKPEICKVFENRFWPVHMKEHTRKPPYDQKIISHLRNMCGIMHFEILECKILRLEFWPRDSTNPNMWYIKMTA